MPAPARPCLQSDIQAVLRWSSHAVLEAVRDALQRWEGHTAVSGWGARAVPGVLLSVCTWCGSRGIGVLHRVLLQ